jgi:nucleoside-diphosphate-sugar epimerase
MKTALIMGITGGFGGSAAQALARQGWNIRALMRDPARLPQRFQGAEVTTGDAGDIQAVRKAAQGADLIVYGVNPPGYNWKGVAVPMLDNTARVAEEAGATVIFPGNVYVFDPANGPDFDENAPLRPVTGKGKMRAEMETRLKQASENGARVIVLRMGDYIGENAPSAWFGVIAKRTANGFKLATPGPRDLAHTWAYLPDAARTVAALADKRDDLPAWNVFHFAGYRMSLNHIARTLEQVSARRVRTTGFPWLAIRLMAPFSALFRGLLEMRYLWKREVNLQDTRLERVLGRPVPHTPLPQALMEVGLAGESEPPANNVAHPV